MCDTAMCSLQCCIDLKRNVLVIGTTGTVTPFLTEAELPEFARLNRNPSETVVDDEDSALAQALARSAEEGGWCFPGLKSFVFVF